MRHRMAILFAASATFAVTTAWAGDTYDKEHTDVVLARAARIVKDNCGQAKDADGKATGPWGKTKVTVQLGHGGHSTGASIPAPYDGKPTGKCAVQAFTNLTFPPWSGPDTSVDVDVELVKPGTPPAPPPHSSMR